ncbi:MAG TPA: MarR family transcriptional regulator [Pseudonocardiaceae bacterium]
MFQASADDLHLDQEQLTVANTLGRELIRLMRLSASAHAQAAKRDLNELERATYSLLTHLAEEGPLRSGALAERCHLDPSTVSRQVAHLVQAGLVERRADPEDGRATLLVVTEAGHARLERGQQLRVRAFAHILRDWSPAERRRFVELFERFVSDFERSLPVLVAELAEGARSGGES